MRSIESFIMVKKEVLVLGIVISLEFFLIGYLSLLSSSNAGTKPNVVLITFDALRADHVGSYGYHRNTTPNIDEFAKESVLFKQAFSQSSGTPSSLPSLLTSKYPSEIEMLNKDSTLPKGVETLPGMLNRLEYNTTAFVSSGFFELQNLDRDFDKGRSYWGTEFLTERGRNFIKKTKEPFFLWIHFTYPHCSPNPSPLRGLYTNYTGDCNILNCTHLRQRCDEEEDLRYYINAYDERLKYVDRKFGKIIDALRNRSLYNGSIIIVSSDHGEALGEHRKWQHRNRVYEELIHVPLIMKFPDKRFKGRRVEKQVELIDLMPTLMDILGVQADSNLSGRSLLPLVKNKDTGSSFVISETTLSRAIRTPNYKYIENRKGRNELYNLDEDPEEQNNVINLKPKKAAELREELNKTLGGRS